MRHPFCLSPRFVPLVALITCAVGGCGELPLDPVNVTPSDGLRGFEAQLDSIRVELQIPGMAAAIAEGDEVVWAHGFGFADVENAKPATDTTSFVVASITKSVAAIILMQLVEEGTLDLDDPISDYGVNLEADGTVTVRHVFNHTSEGIPGTVHRYNGGRYIRLGDVMLEATGSTFAQLLAERIITPLGLRHTAPNPDILPDFYTAGLDRQAFLANMAMPYEVVGGQVVPSGYFRHFSPAAGLVTSVRDLAAISIALDQDRFLDPDTKDLMLSPSIEIDGPDRTYGLGWYVQTEQGIRLEWHHGLAVAHSALIVRVPDRGLTFVAVANTSRLTGAYPMGGDVTQNAFAGLFFDSFVIGTNS